MAEDKQQIPAKYDLNAKWEACLDLTLRRFVYSSAAGAFGGLLLFRTPVTRWASVAFGAGVGLGRAYSECSYKFGSPSKCKGPSQDSHEPSPSSSEVTPVDQQTVKKDQED
ncbi:MICOS complex subunit MIC10-like [Aristolochia californica]|uniref:MICOS complex subunit MIC10-like n=1 Tax=Aristolochia californica TaxID=171875 RepID=UPI0035DB7577